MVSRPLLEMVAMAVAMSLLVSTIADGEFFFYEVVHVKRARRTLVVAKNIWATFEARNEERQLHMHHNNVM
jgi:hypothetical protein